MPTEPTFVSLKELPELSDDEFKKETELDTSKRQETEPPEKATRIADIDRRVKQEMAPRGDDARDQPSVPKSSVTPPVPQKQIKQPQVPVEQPDPRRQPTDKGILPAAPAPKSEPVPSLQTLTKLTPETLERMGRKAQRERIKKRDNILEGDEVYLNLQHDFLISFFKRFSNRIESVWNYPEKAALQGEQGILLLKITVTREGELIDVDLLESSGSDTLDFEAIQAVYRAAPFGPVTKHWPHEQMKIYAYFQYTLTNRYIFGK